MAQWSLGDRNWKSSRGLLLDVRVCYGTDLMTGDASNRDSIEELIEAGSSIAGSATGAAIAILGGDPASALAGSVAGSVLATGLKLLAQELRQRFLGPREEARLGAALAFAAERIQAKLEGGEKIREDGFFSSPGGDARASSEEILEAVLLVAQREYQEKKLRFHANLLANLVFDSSVAPEQAHVLIKLGEDLTYRQLCLLALFPKHADALRSNDYKGESALDTNIIALLVEIFDLYTRGLLNASGVALLSLPNIVPSKMRIQGTGAQLFNMMELSRIPNNDLLELMDSLMK